MSDFRKAFMITAIPIVVLSLISTAGASMESIYNAWFIAGGLWVIAILSAIGFTIAHKRQIASGIFAGIGIGIVALGATCIANLSTVSF